MDLAGDFYEGDESLCPVYGHNVLAKFRFLNFVFSLLFSGIKRNYFYHVVIFRCQDYLVKFR